MTLIRALAPALAAFVLTCRRLPAALLMVWYNAVPWTARRVRGVLRFVCGPVAFLGVMMQVVARRWVELYAPAELLNAVNGGRSYIARRLQLAMQRGVRFFNGDGRNGRTIEIGDLSHAGVEFVKALMRPRVLATLAVALAFMFGAGGAALAMGPIRYLDNISRMETYVFTPAVDAGKRIYVDLDNGKATRYVQIRLSGDVTIAAAAATAIRNFGLAEALFEEIGVTGGGEGDTINADGRLLSFASEWMLVPSATTRTRVTSTAAAVTSVASIFRLWFENPQSVAPRETLFLEKQVNQKFRAFFKLSTQVSGGAAGSTPGAGRILEAAGACVTSYTMTVRVQQFADATLRADALPLFRYKVEQLRDVPGGVVARRGIEIPLDELEYLRGLTVAFDSTAGLATGIVTEIGLRGDKFEYIGQGQMVPLDDFARAQAFESGGDIYSLFGPTMVHINFQKAGRLSNIFNPKQDTNLKLFVDIAAVPAGVNIIVVKHSLMRDLWKDPATGRMVCAPELPADLAA